MPRTSSWRWRPTKGWAGGHINMGHPIHMCQRRMSKLRKKTAGHHRRRQHLKCMFEGRCFGQLFLFGESYKKSLLRLNRKSYLHFGAEASELVLNRFKPLLYLVTTPWGLRLSLWRRACLFIVCGTGTMCLIATHLIRHHLGGGTCYNH
jgi:hypothetical protein